MNITGLFIRRPAATALIMLAILAFGLLGYRDLAVSDLPNVDFPTIQVSAALSGASPETMASAVATPLEKQFTTIAGLDSMTSTSALGSTQITLQFDLSRNIDSAALDVQSAITSAANQLPPDMPSPPTFRKVNPADSPVLFLALTSTTLPLSMVDEYAETLLGQQISMVPGVAQVAVFGSMKYAVRIQVDPGQLAARRIGIDEVLHSIQSANVNMPMGTLDGAHSAFNIQSNGQLTDASLFRPLIVAYRNGAPVRLHEVATVTDSVQDNRLAGWINGEPGIILSIQRQPGTNTIAVVDGILKLLPRFRSIMPPAMHLTIEYDRSISIRESVNDVKFTLFLAICLVVLVIFLFLRNLSATVIPSLAVPMSIVGTFAVMYLLGYTIDNLSLLALTLSVGFVVDDAIVMLENIVRHMEQGKGVREAAFEGSREIGFTIISMTLALAAVFLPVFFMGGIIGRLLHEFAVVIASAVLVSGFVSLTLTPMLCSRYLRAGHAREHGWMYRTLENVLEAALRRYGYTLRWALRHRVVVMLFGGVILAGTAWEFWTIPKGFLPEEDTSQIYVFSEARQGISFDAMKKYQEALNQIILADPNTLQFFSRISRLQYHRPQQRPRQRPPEGAFRAPVDRQPRVRPARREIRRDARGRLARPRHPPAVRASHVHRGHHRRTAAQTQHPPRRARLPAEPAVDPHRRPGDQEPVPVHAGQSADGESLRKCAVLRRQDGGVAGPHERHHRSADQESPGQRDCGPRQGLGSGCHATGRGRRSLQRLWPAPGLDHLRAQQRILCHPPGAGSLSKRSRHALGTLYPLVRRANSSR